MENCIDLIILAGGAGVRMGGLDKGLLGIDGEPAVARLARQLLDQGDHLIISANRHLTEYAAMGGTVVTDAEPGQGPLAGLLAAVEVCQHPFQLVLPCDMPWLPRQLRHTLTAPRGQTINVLHDGERLQPLCMGLDARYWRQALYDWVQGPRRSVQGWLEDKPIKVKTVADAPPGAFANLNHPEDLQRSP